MTDYGRPVSFGLFPVPNAAESKQLLAEVQYADAAGLDILGIQDHPYQRRFVDTFTLIGWLAGQTRRIGFFPDVANLPLRPPAMLAKMAASLDVLSGGRFDLGLGAGAFWDAIAAMGGPRREPGDAVDALTEAIAVLRLMWSGDRGLRYDGTHYSLSGVHSGPVPTRDIGIWLGAGGPRMLRIVGRLADGWVPSSAWAGPERLPELQNRIDEAANGSGREPAEIRRLYNVNGVITDGPSRGFLDGPADQWVEELTQLTIELGMDTYLVGFAGQADRTQQLSRYAEEIAPAVRDAVAAERGSGK